MRRWFSRTKLLLESEQISLLTNTLDDATLNSYRILTTQDLGGIVGPPGPPGPPGADGIPTSLAAIGAVPNANGASLSGSTLNLQPANGSFGGVITTGTQTIAGQKTFSGKTFLSGTKDNLPSNNEAERVLVINGNTGQLSCKPAFSPPVDVDWTLNTGTITTSTITPAKSNFYALFAGNMIFLAIQPPGLGNMLITAITGSPTILNLTGAVTPLADIYPAGDISFIGPFINNGVFTSAKWTMTALGNVTIELIPPGTVFTVPFGVGTNSFTLSYPAGSI